MKERQRLDYPPFGRLIRITFKHRNRELVENAAQWFANVIRQSYEKTVLGPVAPPVSRIQNQYLQQLLLKMPTSSSIQGKKIMALSPRTLSNVTFCLLV